MLFDIERTDEPCPKCAAKMERHITAGPLGKLRTQLWCPNRDYAGEWEMRPGDYIPGAKGQQY